MYYMHVTAYTKPLLPLISRFIFRRSLTTYPRLRNSKTASEHHDTESFIKYAKYAAVDPNTTVYVGTLFEYTVLSCLQKFNMNLVRTGGPNDGGVDIRGTWELPEPVEGSDEPRILNILVSCKQQKSGPKDIRELEGAIGSSDSKTIGILASLKPCPRKGIETILLSHRPLAFCCIKSYEEGGYLRQFIWNGPAEVLLKGLGVATRYRKGEKDDVTQEAFLTFNDKILKGPVKRRRKKSS